MTSLRTPLLPPLEKEVLGRIIRGEDPWNGFRGTAGVSGRYSHAVNRLKQKGYVVERWDAEAQAYDYFVTEAGVRALREES